MSSASPDAPQELLRTSLTTGQTRTARPTANLDRARAFYETTLGLPVLASFDDHDGYDGIILGLPDRNRQLELVHSSHSSPSPTPEDQLVLYLGSADTVATISTHLEHQGYSKKRNPNPFWENDGAVAFADPDGYWLILSPERW